MKIKLNIDAAAERTKGRTRRVRDRAHQAVGWAKAKRPRRKKNR